ncbi:hypothetical protein GCM10011512_11990 [Tersicoccus solisilvae]|uniref:Uncharacterized protein n=1 Tax=Tersicoccus solisilvae TaxID=1882339 RepID=A0ABQ1P0J3_9MICC|nr:DUF6882 domain-containing protein [Tersicoccus solisilvae]GGC86682.1 hypothetical protein GCM10011512_11990 [Tersicoccus solisilvae]
MTSALQSLVDRGLFLSVEHQRAFEDQLVPDAAQVDFAGPRIVLPGLDSPATPYLLGSSSPTRGTWIWSWQEPGHFLPAVLAAAESTRRYGVDHDVAELTDDEIPLIPGLDERLVIAAKTVTGVHAHYTAGAGGGARVWMLVRSDALTLDRPTVRTVGRTIAEGLHTGLAVDHRAAVEGYARRRGLHLSADGEDAVVVSTDDGGVELRFDGTTIRGIDVVASRRPAGYAPEPVPVTLIEPAPTPRPEPEPVSEQPAATEAAPVPEQPAATEAAPVPAQPAATEAAPEPQRSAPEPETRATPAPQADEELEEREPEEQEPEEREPEEQERVERDESRDEEQEPRRRGFLGRLFGR